MKGSGLSPVILPSGFGYSIRLAWLAGRLFQHLHMSRRSALTVIQREMVATVVNGLIDGAP